MILNPGAELHALRQRLETLERLLTMPPSGGSAATLLAAHAAASDPHSVYATDADLAAHVAASDPHSVYATDADLAAHVAASNPHPTYATDADLTAHTAAADPHPVYTTDADASYLAALGLAITFGTWTAYTPGTSNVSGSNPVDGWYVRAGMTCWYQIIMASGNTASSANPIQFNLPPGVTGARMTPADAMKGAAKVSALAGNNSALTVTVWADAAGANFTNGQGLGTIRLVGVVESTT